MVRRVLITGASGYIGGEILALMDDVGRESLKSQLEVFGVYRNESHRSHLERLGCSPVKLDLGDPAAVKKFILDHKIEIVVELTNPFQSELAVAMIEALGAASKSSTFISTGGAKFFASFAGFDTSKTIYDDENPLNLQPTKEEEWDIAASGRESYRTILSAGRSAHVSTHIVIPPIVYGQSRTFGNPISRQNAALCEVLIHYRQAINVRGVDSLPQDYAMCHVEDCANLYLKLVESAAKGKPAVDGLYFAENGVIAWKRLAEEFAKGLNLRAEVTIAGPEMIKEIPKVLGIKDVSWVRAWVGGRTNISGRAGKKIGWQPKYGPEHAYAAASEEARFISRHIWNGKDGDHRRDGHLRHSPPD